MHQSPQRRITTVYFIVATLWILFSDGVMYLLGVEPGLISRLSVIKGMAFVVVTSVFLYFYIRNKFNRRFRLEVELRAHMEQVRQSQTALENSEWRFRTAVQESPLPTIIFTEDGEVIAISRSWLAITGYTAEQLKTIDSWTELAYGENKQPVKNQIDKLFELTTRTDEGEFLIRCRDGSLRNWEFSSTPLGSLPDNRRIAVSIAKDVTEQKRAALVALEYERLTARFQKEQERNIFVQRIVSALSHDLRTPLTVISTSRESLSAYFDRLTPEKRLEKLDTIGRETQFAIELLEDTVNMARGIHTEGGFRPLMVNIAALCQVSVDEVRTAKHVMHNLRFVNLSGLETAAVDEVLVSRILLNLLSNALKYSNEDSEVRLELDQHENWLVLRVTDQGMGISEADLPYIFDPFFRTKSAEAITGTGLGLSIVKDCVDRHHGRIHVSSVLGAGTTFVVELPLKTTAEAVAANAPIAGVPK